SGARLLGRAAAGRNDRRPLRAHLDLLVPRRDDRHREFLHPRHAQGASTIGIKRWLKSTSNRTFIVWPVALFGVEALLQQGVPVIHWWALPLLAWGSLQYWLVGKFRSREGGGGPGIAIPPERIVREGPYRFVRNPMYLGHLIFFAGLALTLGSWIAAAVLAFHALWFDRGVREGQGRLGGLFGGDYRDYCRPVDRRIPGGRLCVLWARRAA